MVTAGITHRKNMFESSVVGHFLQVQLLLLLLGMLPCLDCDIAVLSVDAVVADVVVAAAVVVVVVVVVVAVAVAVVVVAVVVFV